MPNVEIMTPSPAVNALAIPQGGEIVPLANAKKAVCKVLIIEDDEFDAAITKELLERHAIRDFQVTRAKTLKAAIEVLGQNQFDITLVDMGLPDSSGLMTIREVIRASAETPIVVLTGNDDTQHALEAMQMGAQDYLPKSLLNSKSLERVVEYSIHRKTIQADLTELAYTDTLTGLMNRRVLHERWQRITARANRAKRKIGVLLIDVNKFKEVNDRFGHVAGDNLLVHIAAELRSTVRTTDLVARLSGDEFVVVLEGLRSQKELNAIRDKISFLLSDSFVTEDRAIHYSASVGGALTWPKDNEDLMSVVKRADAEMYTYKERLKRIAG